MRKLAVLLTVVSALVVPALARAGDVAMHLQEIPLGTRSLATAAAPMHFNMLAVHWIGPGSVLYRTRRLHGGWRAWRTADADVAPDGGTGRWHDGNLDWTAASDAIQFRTNGRVLRLRAYELWSRVTSAPGRGLSTAESPSIVGRAQWGANEEIVRASPRLAPALRLAVVHHTAGTNSYTPAQSAAIVRGIELYHVRGNGWNDIGYNFLVDRYGTVFEGRAGGIERNVVGAHSEGFNTGTVGVSLIGNYSAATPPKAQRDALVALLAWRLDLAHVDPLSTVVYTSGGNLKFRAGKPVTLRAVSGHRDTGPSECPGTGAYRLLAGIAKRVSLTGLPKIYGPTVAGSLGGSIRFRARLTAALPWTVTVADPLGHTVAHGSGRGGLVDWTWRSPTSTARFLWTIATPGALVATGTIGTGKPLPPPGPVTLTALTETPSVITPAADGSGAEATAVFQLGAAAHVAASVTDAAGTPVLALLDEQRPAGPNTFTWSAATLTDGRYRLVVTAMAHGKTVSASLDIVVDRSLSALAAGPPAFSPNGDGIQDTTTLSFTLAQTLPLRVEIRQGGTVLATLFAGELGAGMHTLDWDGTGEAGVVLPDGVYEAVFTVTDGLGDVPVSVPVTLDTKPPNLSLLDPHILEFTLSEPATVTVLVNRSTRIVKGEPSGAFTLPFEGGVAALSAQAQDAAGNFSALITA